MAMGKKKRRQQEDLWVATSELPRTYIHHRNDREYRGVKEQRRIGYVGTSVRQVGQLGDWIKQDALGQIGVGTRGYYVFNIQRLRIDDTQLSTEKVGDIESALIWKQCQAAGAGFDRDGGQSVERQLVDDLDGIGARIGHIHPPVRAGDHTERLISHG